MADHYLRAFNHAQVALDPVEEARASEERGSKEKEKEKRRSSVQAVKVRRITHTPAPAPAPTLPSAHPTDRVHPPCSSPASRLLSLGSTCLLTMEG